MASGPKSPAAQNKPKEPVFRVVARVSAPEMAELLQSAELRAVEEPVAAARGLRILEPKFVSDALNDVCHVDWDAATIRRLLAEQRDLLVPFILADHREWARHVEEEEHPEGEEPAERDKPVTVEVLGLTRGFALGYLTRLHILRQLGKGGLRAPEAPGMAVLAEDGDDDGGAVGPGGAGARVRRATALSTGG